MKKTFKSVKFSVIDRIERFRKTDVGTFAFRLKDHCVDDNILATGAQLAYYLLIAFFPLLIFILSVLSYTMFSQDLVLEQFFHILPENTRDLIMPVLLDIVDKRSTTLLSTSLILALWSGSSGVKQLILAIDKAFSLESEKRKLLKMRGLSLISMLVLVFLILLTLLSQVFGTVIYDYIVTLIGENQTFQTFWRLLVDLVPLVVIVLAFTVFYFAVPAFPKGQRIRLRHAFIGGLTAGLGWLIISYGFKFYVNRFSNYANTYGSLGGVIVLLIWLFLSSVIIMLGAEVAATSTYMWCLRLQMRKTTEPRDMAAAKTGCD